MNKNLIEREFVRYPFVNDFERQAIRITDDLIKKSVRKVWKELEPYHLSYRARMLIREFLYVRLQTLRAPLPEAEGVHYNLLIRTPDFAYGEEVVKILCGPLFVQKEGICWITAESLIKEKIDLEMQECQVMVFTEWKETVKVDVELPSSTMLANNLRQVECYREAWEKIAKHARKYPSITHFLLVDEHIYQEVTQDEHEMMDRYFAHHIFLPERTKEEIWSCLVQKLEESSFLWEDHFLEDLKEYYDKAYVSTKRTGKEFDEEVFNSILTEFYAKERRNFFLTRDCIPYYKIKSKTADEVLEQMNKLVGLEKVKQEFRKLYLDGQLGKSMGKRYHMIFTGNPGTGKTTVAKMTADLLFAMHITKTNKLVQAKPSDFVSEWKGGTGKKASTLIQTAYDGVLFIDEAYGLETIANREEILNILLQEMEEHAENLLVILAGYTEDMRRLLKCNPGLESRFGKQLEFEDYSENELFQIFCDKCEKEGFEIEKSAWEDLKDCIRYRKCKENFGNAREMENLFEEVREMWAERTEKEENVTEQNLLVFISSDFRKTLPQKEKVQLEDLTGLTTLKKKLREFEREASYKKWLREKGKVEPIGNTNHMLFLGNPGTGKTTVARILSEDLYALGVTRTNRMVTIQKNTIQESRVGETAKRIKDAIRRAIGGVLFLDEAYEFVPGAAQEVVEVLLEEMENHKEDLVVILAGYPYEMQEFLKRNPGLESRIGYTFHFDDYSAGELLEIYEHKMQNNGFVISLDAKSRVAELIEFFIEIPNLGNARFVDKLIQLTISRRAQRSFRDMFLDIEKDDVPRKEEVIEILPEGRDLVMEHEREENYKIRTAVHEIGHALVMMHFHPEQLSVSISIRRRAHSLGRVQNQSSVIGDFSERHLKEMLATCLAGRNAEILLLGDNSVGCEQDYQKAKYLAEGMVSLYAMGTIGKTTPRDFLMEADRKSMEILRSYQSRMADLAKLLMKKEVLTGKELHDYLRKEKKGEKDNE